MQCQASRVLRSALRALAGEIDFPSMRDTVLFNESEETCIPQADLQLQTQPVLVKKIFRVLR